MPTGGAELAYQARRRRAAGRRSSISYRHHTHIHSRKKPNRRRALDEAPHKMVRGAGRPGPGGAAACRTGERAEPSQRGARSGGRPRRSPAAVAIPAQTRPARAIYVTSGQQLPLQQSGNPNALGRYRSGGAESKPRRRRRPSGTGPRARADVIPLGRPGSAARHDRHSGAADSVRRRPQLRRH